MGRAVEVNAGQSQGNPKNMATKWKEPELGIRSQVLNQKVREVRLDVARGKRKESPE